jgi:alginate O-acetyltransferase complex protein AlgJ
MRALAVWRIGLFALALIWPLATLGRTGGELTEKRDRVALPAWHLRGGYPQKFDNYFRDNFGSRDRFIRWHNLLKLRLLRESPVDRVIVGRDGWYFYSATADGIDIRNFSGRWPHTPADIEAWLNRQDAREREYAQIGTRYLIVVAPEKHNAYPAFVPSRYGPQAPGVMDEVLAHLKNHPRLQILDLRPILQPRANAQLYYKGDSHWNAQGAFLAAQAITEALRPALPDIGVIRESDYDLHVAPHDSGDLVKMIASSLTVDDRMFVYQSRTPRARIVHDAPANTVWEQPGTRLPTAMLIGDSFGVVLEPILCDAFSRLHYKMTTTEPITFRAVAEERPDVVVLMIVERYLPRLMEQ